MSFSLRPTTHSYNITEVRRNNFSVDFPNGESTDTIDTIVEDREDSVEVELVDNHDRTGVTHLNRAKKVHVTKNKRGRIYDKKKELDLTFVSLNCRSSNNKKESVREILANQCVDVAVCSELNLNWNPPKMKGYMTYHRKAKKSFHGIAMYVADHLCDTTMRIPDEDEELETIHILLKKTNPNISIIGCYLDVESRADNVTIERVWSKLLLKVRTDLGRGEGGNTNGGPKQTPPNTETEFWHKIITGLGSFRNCVHTKRQKHPHQNRPIYSEGINIGPRGGI